MGIDSYIDFNKISKTREPFVKSIPKSTGQACNPLRRLQEKIQKANPHSDAYAVFLLEFYRLENKIRKEWNYKECIWGEERGPCKDDVILPCDACDGENHSKSQGNKLSN